MRLSYQKFWLILWCWTTQIPVKQAQVLCKVSRKGIYHWYDLFRSHLPQNEVILSKIVQLDEAFFKKRALMMAKQQGTRKLAFEILEAAGQRQDAAYFLQTYIQPGSDLHTDKGGIYQGIEKWWPVTHRIDIHSKFEFGLTSEIEGIFGNFRTFVRRMYHHVTPDYLPDLVREFCFRFSSPQIFENPQLYLSKTLTLVPRR